jgi:hydroxysqualene dehydroxylase
MTGSVHLQPGAKASAVLQSDREAIAPADCKPLNIAVVGGGWAGFAAAVEITTQGHRATVLEAARALGGRARGLFDENSDNNAQGDSACLLDNGQHILIGAYTQTLRLMQVVGLDIHKALLRMPLTLQFPDGTGLQLPPLPAPVDALWGIVTARGWTWNDKFSLLRCSLRWQWQNFVCAPHATVRDVCVGMSPRVVQELIEPLCASALNTPAERASGQVFLRVMHDALFAHNGGSNLLLPCVD